MRSLPSRVNCILLPLSQEPVSGLLSANVMENGGKWDAFTNVPFVFFYMRFAAVHLQHCCWEHKFKLAEFSVLIF